MVPGELADLVQCGCDAPRLAGRLLADVLKKIRRDLHVAAQKPRKDGRVLVVTRLRQLEV
jgi:hypothetical protein